jgi:hypothetical protein
MRREGEERRGRGREGEREKKRERREGGWTRESVRLYAQQDCRKCSLKVVLFDSLKKI